MILDQEGAWLTPYTHTYARLLLRPPRPEGIGYLAVTDSDALAPVVKLTATREYNRIATNLEPLDFGFLDHPTPVTHVGLFDKHDQIIAYGVLEKPYRDLHGAVTMGVGALMVRLERDAVA